MRFVLIAAFAFLATLSAPARAEGLDLFGGREYIGSGRLFTDDYFGDGQDRWRTGAYSMSFLWAPAGTISLPEEFGSLIELRYTIGLTAPSNLRRPAAGDRRYAGVATFGAYSHFTKANTDFSLGVEAVVSGPISGAPWIQMRVHDLLGSTGPSSATLATQFPNALQFAAAGEVAHRFSFGSGLELRPFVQGRAGDVNYVRVGADLIIGSNYTSGILLRDETTGQLYQGLYEVPRNGFSFLVGADTAKVLSSTWLPASQYTLTNTWNRARAGVQWQSDWVGVFYGATWMGPEFTAQPSGQVVGSVQLQLSF
jgi:hypothetical protein